MSDHGDDDDEEDNGVESDKGDSVVDRDVLVGFPQTWLGCMLIQEVDSDTLTGNGDGETSTVPLLYVCLISYELQEFFPCDFGICNTLPFSFFSCHTLGVTLCSSPLHT